ncbi:MAG: type II toxin-antitoxin system HicA family toxin [Steroidobacteraceae bacterium]
MSNADKLLDQMRRNPRDWRIDDLFVVAASVGLIVRPAKGSHVKFSYPHMLLQIAVPTRRPIREIYIRKFVELVEEVLTKS